MQKNNICKIAAAVVVGTVFGASIKKITKSMEEKSREDRITELAFETIEACGFDSDLLDECIMVMDDTLEIFVSTGLTADDLNKMMERLPQYKNAWEQLMEDCCKAVESKMEEMEEEGIHTVTLNYVEDATDEKPGNLLLFQVVNGEVTIKHGASGDLERIIELAEDIVKDAFGEEKENVFNIMLPGNDTVTIFVSTGLTLEDLKIIVKHNTVWKMVEDTCRLAVENKIHDMEKEGVKTVILNYVEDATDSGDVNRLLLQVKNNEVTYSCMEEE